jgi:hypothetical protein
MTTVSKKIMHLVYPSVGNEFKITMQQSLLGIDSVAITLKDTNTAKALEHSIGIFYAVRAEMI